MPAVHVPLVRFFNLLIIQGSEVMAFDDECRNKNLANATGLPVAEIEAFFDDPNAYVQGNGGRGPANP